MSLAKVSRLLEVSTRRLLGGAIHLHYHSDYCSLDGCLLCLSSPGGGLTPRTGATSASNRLQLVVMAMVLTTITVPEVTFADLIPVKLGKLSYALVAIYGFVAVCILQLECSSCCCCGCWKATWHQKSKRPCSLFDTTKKLALW